MAFDSERDGREKSQAIKVVDRRRFTSSGEVRPDAPPLEARNKARQETPATPPASPDPTSPPASRPHQAESATAEFELSEDALEDTGEEGEGQEAVEFLSFVASLATNAMAALGMLPEHESQGMPKNPAIAREYIDIIAMLERRTRGNLSPQEAKTMARLLGDLRMGYVEATRSVQPARLPPEMMRPR